jgi:hypothetical protein
MRLVPAAALETDAWVARLAAGMATFELVEFEDDDPRPTIVLELAGPWNLLIVSSGRFGVAATRGPESLADRWFVALCSEPPCALDDEDWARAPELEVQAPRAEPDGWHDRSWQLSMHPWCRLGSRDWSWAWGRKSAGPVSLQIWLDADAEAIASALAAVGGLPYRPSSPGELRSFSRAVHDERVLVEDGLLILMRSFHEPPEHIASFDAGLLAALAEGSLGPLAWDLVDGDYGFYVATGEDGASLARYLDPSVPTEPLEQEWRALFQPVIIDARAADSRDALFTVVADALGLGAAERFVERLATTPIPRRIDVRVSSRLDDGDSGAWFFDQTKARPRTQWSLRWDQ